MQDSIIEQQTIIKFLTLEGVAPMQILERLQKVYRKETLSLSQVEYWAMEANDDRPELAMTMRLRSAEVILFVYTIWRE